MEKLFVVLILAWFCGVVRTNSTQWPPTTQNGNLSCEVDFLVHENWDKIYVYTNYSIECYGCEGWYNNSLQGGRRQITTFNNLPKMCRDMLEWEYYVVVALKEAHPDIETISEDIQTLSGCAVYNTSMECIFDVDILVKKCNGDLIYYLKYIDWEIETQYYLYTYYCFEKVYTNPCDTTLETSYYYEQINDDLYMVRTYWNEWHNFNLEGIQYIIPSVEDLQFFDWGVLLEFQPEYYYYYYYFYNDYFPIYAVEGDRAYWTRLDETATELKLCQYIIYDGTLGYDNDNVTCNGYFDHIYAFRCNDGIRYHFPRRTYLWLTVVNANMNRPVVIPELYHEPVVSNINGVMTSAYKPVLQFKCSFTINSTELYIVNWYINDFLVATRGPTNNKDELLLKETDLNSMKLGFDVKCSYQISTVHANETFSQDFYAGFKILDTDVRLSRRGSETIRAKLTVPMGCLHAAFEDTPCSQPLILYDPNKDDKECDGYISVTNGEGDKCFEGIQTLKFGDTWDPNIIYKFIVTTVEHTYDDRTDFNLSISVPGSNEHDIWQGYEQSGIKVKVTENGTTSNNWHWNYYRNKICYSRGDPHMKTADGKWYPQQKEGDYMMYQNINFQIEVQESTMYCFGNSGPVCECGIAVRAGQDVFMIDRCGDVNYLDFPYCGDGGLLDVQVVNDYRYVVTTPIGTKIIIQFTWGKFMDTTIMMSAKDFGNTRGLCGNFDNNWQNDYTLSDGSVTENDYGLFAESWRLSEEMNLFTNSERELEKWSENNTISCICSSNGFCEQGKVSGCKEENSITQTKCGLQGSLRKKRSVVSGERRNQHVPMKRSVNSVISNITATEMCTETVYNSPAVKDFPDMLGDEDPEEVIKQCVFDTTASNDESFVQMYGNAINNVVKNFIDQNPVFAANNTEAVEKFLQKTCLNNCSGNGECLISGQCECHDVYRGPDCSIDTRIPPIIKAIDNAQCDLASNDLCECFVVRTDNIFDGYSFNLKTTQNYFDGEHRLVGDNVNTGIREDIYTGLVCLPHLRTKRDVQERSDYILSFSIALSNDGSSFGTTHTVVIYDSTCHEIKINGDVVIVNLKEGYCYITGTCIPDGHRDGCRLCNSKVMPFEWSLDNCEDASKMSLGIIIGIVASCTVFILIVIAALVYKMYTRSRKNRVQDVPNSVIITSTDGQLPTNYNNEKQHSAPANHKFTMQ